MTATLQESTSLGLPALPDTGPVAGLTGGLASLLGSHSINIWYLNPTHVRISEPVSMGESDLRLDGSKLWLWDSKTQTATRVLLPADAGKLLLRGRGSIRLGPSAQLPDVRQLLAAAGPTTSIRVGQNATVAGQAAYQLVIAPKASGSLVSQIVIAIDARNYMRLRVQVFARGVASPVIQAGYSSLSFGRPAASNFSFAPPSGAIVKTVRVPDTLPSGLLGSSGLAGLSSGGIPGLPAGVSVGNSSAPLTPLPKSVHVPNGPLKQIVLSFAGSLPAKMPAAQRARLIKSFISQVNQGITVNPTNGGGFTEITPPSSAVGDLATGQPTVVGKGWLSVLMTPPSPEVAALIKQVLADPTTAGGPQASYSSSQGSSTEFVLMGPAALPDPALLRALVRASTKVSGSWGSGRLLRTSLVSILVTSNGRILAGAVTPAVLYADAASAAR